MAKAMIWVATIVEPTGVPDKIEVRIPISAQHTERMAEHMVTARKFLKRRIAESAGKMSNAEMRREPTRFIASTMMTAVITAISKL